MGGEGRCMGLWGCWVDKGDREVERVDTLDDPSLFS